MKKILRWIGIVVLAGIVLPASAQLRFGVKGGVNISSVHISNLPENFNSSNVTGFHIGPMIEASIPLVGTGVEAAVLYSQKGVEVNNEAMKVDYIDVPVHLKWKFGLPIVKGYLATGPYMAFRVGGDKVWNVVQQQIEAKTFGLGWDFGAGVEVINHLQVGFNYGLGLTNSYSLDGESDGKNRGWMITAAILF